MKKYKCVCNEEFESFVDYTKYAKDYVISQMKPSCKDKERIKNEI